MDFKSLTDPVVIVGDKNAQKPSFFKRIREPFSKLSPKFKKTAAVTLTVFMVFALVLGVYISRKPTDLTPQASADGVDLSLQPQNVTSDKDQEFSVDVFVNPGQTGLKLAAIQAKIDYDPTKLELKNVALKDFLPVPLLRPQNTSGSTKFVVGSEPSDPKAGSGVIATITFKSLVDIGSTQITFDTTKTLVAVYDRTNNVLGDANGSSVVFLHGTPAPSSSPSPSPSINPNPENSLTLESPNNVTAGQEFAVKIYTRSDVDAANLWVADITYPKDSLEVVRVDKTGSVISSWATEHFDNQSGEATLVGGIPDPGLKTNKQNVLFSTIIFKGKENGTANIRFTNDSQIYRNSDNINILQTKRDASVTISGTTNASPSPQPSVSASPIASPSVSTGKGDGDGNGVVNLKDLSILFSKWSPLVDITSNFQLDFNDDKRINTFDFSEMNNLLFSLGVIRR